MTGQSSVNTFHTSTTSIYACLLLVYFEYANKGCVDVYRQKESILQTDVYLLFKFVKNQMYEKKVLCLIVESRPLQKYNISDVRCQDQPKATSRLP